MMVVYEFLGLPPDRVANHIGINRLGFLIGLRYK